MKPLGGPQRVHLMDELRGALILYVVIYHLLYDLAVLFPVGIPWMFSPWMNRCRDILTGGLILISGISCNYSRNNLRRGLRTFALGLGLTVATGLIMPGQLIIFGILHFFGAMMMLYGLCQPALERIPAPVGAVGCGGLFFLTWPVYGGYLMLFGQRIYLPDFLYRQPLLFPLGFSCPGIFSADYYPLMPWGFLFLAGAFLGRYVKAGVLPELCYRRHLPVLGWLGRHTMAIYLIHQPVIFGVLTLLFAAGA
ncbi:MAG: DUF1624 domain-containing protein [Angelakisella sp.]|jgi:uncharacterized membrane protein|nr:DUF1624 domain-containing protein [Angelakisella sp.]MCI9529257.1 DUF1624 domain-containing protein [Angelakisella sp.]